MPNCTTTRQDPKGDALKSTKPKDERKYLLPGPTAKLTADVAFRLAKANVPHILWGQMAMRLMGVLNDVKELQYVVPDKLLQTAQKALLKAGYQPCHKGLDCAIFHRQDRADPPPHEHCHIPQSPEHEAIGLYKQSETLWHVLFDLDLPAPGDDDFMLASDSRLPRISLPDGKGPISADLFPVKMLTPSHLVDSLVILACRDHGHCSRYANWWIASLLHIIMYPKKSGLLDEGNIRARYRPFWQSMQENSGSEMYTRLAELREMLVRRKEPSFFPHAQAS